MAGCAGWILGRRARANAKDELQRPQSQQHRHRQSGRSSSGQGKRNRRSLCVATPRALGHRGGTSWQIAGFRPVCAALRIGLGAWIGAADWIGGLDRVGAVTPPGAKVVCGGRCGGARERGRPPSGLVRVWCPGEA